MSTWLCRIAVHVAHHHRRRRDRRPTVSLEVVADPREGVAGPGPERDVEVRQHLERLYEHLEHLKPKQRIAFVLHVVYDHPISEVAALMGASKAATKSRVFWARRTLLARLRRDPELRELLAQGEVG